MEDLYFENQNFQTEGEALPAEHDGSMIGIAIITIAASVIGGAVSGCTSGNGG